MSNQLLSTEELTTRFYSVKEQRDRFLGFCRAVCPESPRGAAVWDHETGNMFRELLNCDRARLVDLLDKAASYCPVHVQDEIRKALNAPRPAHPSRLVEALKAIRDPEHCLTAFTVQGLRDIATAALQEIDPKNDYSGCVGVEREPEQLEGFNCYAGFCPPSPHCVCPMCGKSGSIVNQCGCDPGNTPTRIEEPVVHDDADMPVPNTCVECGEIAVGYDEGTPLCAAHHRSRR
jgi:hypothetical protein